MELKLIHLIQDFCDNVNPVDGNAAHSTDLQRLVLIAHHALSYNLSIEENYFFDALMKKYPNADKDTFKSYANGYKIQADDIKSILNVAKTLNIKL